MLIKKITSKSWCTTAIWGWAVGGGGQNASRNGWPGMELEYLFYFALAVDICIGCGGPWLDIGSR